MERMVQMVGKVRVYTDDNRNKNNNSNSKIIMIVYRNYKIENDK